MGQGRQRLGDLLPVAMLTDTQWAAFCMLAVLHPVACLQTVPKTLLCVGAAYLPFTPLPWPFALRVHHLGFAV